MTLEEKIAHLQATSMEEARAEGNAIIDSYREALQKVFDDHKEEAMLQSETRKMCIRDRWVTVQLFAEPIFPCCMFHGDSP